ncbi:LPS export ABC transporter periplasmic protein LptC [Lysobacter niastensis]|uniref:Lipopolysaccharide export system protein LptC n=1 Tax=Lysobacter niastensis TaxID=380629 RepID=A0ABS0B2E8_9GAMM|nr:LPS export ABC transporter periplasmic protein LptC [Lysobacter niastensis]MBF6022660.1 LPS export ABC transporter periplasmic protein LptC [Lysobacter niastensis]
MSWRGIATVLLLIAALLTGWVRWLQRDKEQGQSHAQRRPDYVLSDFELVALDKKGQESFTLSAPRLERDPDAKTMTIATPLFVIPPTPGSQDKPWEVRARTGWVSPEGKELRLRGQVTANNTNRSGKAVSMETEELNVFPDEKRATSNAPITVRQPGFTLNGRGLDADLKANNIALKSDIKGRYERTPR